MTQLTIKTPENLGNVMLQKIISQRELSVLKVLRERQSLQTSTSDIGEIATQSGIRDNQEVQRALYLLEGKNFVKPDPEGDFTSNRWRITDVGMKALLMLS